MAKLKVLMIGRDTMYTSPGGDTTQIEMTAKYLRLLNVNVDVHLAKDKINYVGYDIIHFFNIIRPDDILAHINSAIPAVVSTIYVDYAEYEKQERKGLSGLILKKFNPNQIEYIKAIARFVVKGDKIKSLYYLTRGHSKSIHKIARLSTLLLPNSHSEYNRLKKDHLIDKHYVKIVNAIDHKMFDEDSVTANNNYKDHVLCVGRIEGRKNQLNLIKALINTEMKLTLIGKPALNQMGYYHECRKIASGASNINFVEQTNHTELASIYKAAKVHVLPSWFETTGLSSLEAAAMNCNIVITDKGDTREYFSDMAYYCDPGNINSIYEAVSKAYREPVKKELKKYILENYTWERTAQQTLAAYETILR